MLVDNQRCYSIKIIGDRRNTVQESHSTYITNRKKNICCSQSKNDISFSEFSNRHFHMACMMILSVLSASDIVSCTNRKLWQLTDKLLSSLSNNIRVVIWGWVSTALVLRPEYSGRTRSIPRLLDLLGHHHGYRSTGSLRRQGFGRYDIDHVE